MNGADWKLENSQNETNGQDLTLVAGRRFHFPPSFVREEEWIMNTSSMNFSSLSFSPASLQCLHPGSDPYTILILQCLQLDLNFRTFDVLYVLDFEVYNDSLDL